MQSLAVVAGQFGVWVSVIEPGAVASEFTASATRPGDPGPYAGLLAAYLARTRAVFASAQPAQEAGAAIAGAATSQAYRFRWQTSSQAAAFAGVSLADVDGERVSSLTRTWIS
jgi:NAD(P)-dependent dehydrogenase (short-subunit alcohol dehydrogenase family)